MALEYTAVGCDAPRYTGAVGAALATWRVFGTARASGSAAFAAAAAALSRGLLLVALAEAVDAAGRVDELLRARVERVAAPSRRRLEKSPRVERVTKVLPQAHVTRAAG